MIFPRTFGGPFSDHSFFRDPPFFAWHPARNSSGTLPAFLPKTITLLPKIPRLFSCRGWARLSPELSFSPPHATIFSSPFLMIPLFCLVSFRLRLPAHGCLKLFFFYPALSPCSLKVFFRQMFFLSGVFGYFGRMPALLPPPQNPASGGSSPPWPEVWALFRSRTHFGCLGTFFFYGGTVVRSAIGPFTWFFSIRCGSPAFSVRGECFRPRPFPGWFT